MKNRQWKIIFFIQCISLFVSLVSMEDESRQPLLDNQEIDNDIESQQDLDYRPLYFKGLKESYLNSLPLETINQVFLFCDPTRNGLEHLIYCYEPNERVIEKILFAEMNFLLKEKNISLLNEGFDSIISLYKLEPLFYQKSSLLMPLITFSKTLHDGNCDKNMLKKGLEKLCEEVKSKTEGLQRPITSGNFEENSKSILNAKTDIYLKFHHLYLKTIDVSLKTEFDKVIKPRCWYCCVSLKNTPPLLLIVGCGILFFVATQFNYRYQLPGLIVGSCGGVGGLIWVSRTYRLCNKTAIPGYHEKQKNYKEIHKLINLAKKKLSIGFQVDSNMTSNL